jgi:excinuclease ABC subunit A
MAELKQFCRAEKISMTVPFNQLSRADQQAIIEGRGDFGGVRGFFDWMETKKYKLHVRVFLSKYRGYTLCPDCGGGRLRQEARDVKVGGRTLPELCSLLDQRRVRVLRHAATLDRATAIADRILFEVRRG